MVGEVPLPYETTARLRYDFSGSDVPYTVDVVDWATTSRLAQAGRTVDVAYDSVTGNLRTITGPGGLQLDFGFDGLLPTGETWSGPITGTVNGAAINLSYDADSLLTGAGDLAPTMGW